jgi:hypothetical protein
MAASRRRLAGAARHGHMLRSEPGVPAPRDPGAGASQRPLRDPPPRRRWRAPTTLICGAVRFDHPIARNLVGILPPLLSIQASDKPRASWMQGVFKLMAAEARAFQPGGEAVITRLADVLVIQAIRAHPALDRRLRGGVRPRLQARHRPPHGHGQARRPPPAGRPARGRRRQLGPSSEGNDHRHALDGQGFATALAPQDRSRPCSRWLRTWASTRSTSGP